MSVEGSRDSRVERERARLRGDAVRALTQFAASAEFRSAQNAARDAFSAPVPSPTLDAELAGDIRVKLTFYILFDHALDDGNSIAEKFLQRPRPAWQVGAAEQRLIRRFAQARLRLYEVEEVRVDQGLRFRDLWNNQPIDVTERLATHQLTQWDVLAVRVAPEDDGTLRMEGGLYVFPSDLKREIVDGLREEERRLRQVDPGSEDRFFRQAAAFLHRLWLERVVAPPMPVMVTAEGDRMEFGKVVFDVTAFAALRTALDVNPELQSDDNGGYAWVEEADGFTRTLGHIALDAGRLVLEVTSRARAARGRRMLEQAAGATLRYRSARYQSVEEAMRRRPPAGEGEQAEMPPEVAAQVVREYKERHYRTWPDQPIPALDGRTPREAARSAKLRPRLVDLLKSMENHEARSAAPHQPAYDFGPMWKELGVERLT